VLPEHYLLSRCYFFPLEIFFCECRSKAFFGVGSLPFSLKSGPAHLSGPGKFFVPLNFSGSSHPPPSTLCGILNFPPLGDPSFSNPGFFARSAFCFPFSEFPFLPTAPIFGANVVRRSHPAFVNPTFRFSTGDHLSPAHNSPRFFVLVAALQPKPLSWSFY